MNLELIKVVLETVLLCSPEPLRTKQLVKILNEERELDGAEDIDLNLNQIIDSHGIEQALAELQENWKSRGLILCETASGWRFQSTALMQPFLQCITEERPLRYSRAVMETLAIIAYRQPVTRGDIEDIRGVAVNTQIIRQLEDRGWVEAVGTRDVPGRPTLLATTKQFLNDLGLKSLNDLPPLAVISNMKSEMAVGINSETNSEINLNINLDTTAESSVQTEHADSQNQKAFNDSTLSALHPFENLIEQSENHANALIDLDNVDNVDDAVDIAIDDAINTANAEAEIKTIVNVSETDFLTNDSGVNPNLNQCEVSGTVTQNPVATPPDVFCSEQLQTEMHQVVTANQSMESNALDDAVNLVANPFQNLNKEKS